MSNRRKFVKQVSLGTVGAGFLTTISLRELLMPTSNFSTITYAC